MTTRAMTKALVPLAVLLAAAASRGDGHGEDSGRPAKHSGSDDQRQAREGSTLTANNGTWSNTPTSFTYSGSGATSTAPVARRSAAQRARRTRVSPPTSTTACAWSSRRRTPTARPAPTPRPPRSSRRPVRRSTRRSPRSRGGAPTVGNDLTVSDGTWTGGARTFTYQWQRCPGGTATPRASNISGATVKTYTVHAADVGSALRANVIAPQRQRLDPRRRRAT